MPTCHIAIALIAAFALAAPMAANAQSRSDAKHAPVKKHAAKRVAREPQASGEIACTVLGCGPISTRCHPRPGMRPNGNPSGYDVIVCP